ncbi:MAG: DUF1576 domain-containing protein [Christensenella sp.]|nr:DUF1576 domain-containing protein [Christensenella sp.]
MNTRRTLLSRTAPNTSFAGEITVSQQHSRLRLPARNNDRFPYTVMAAFSMLFLAFGFVSDRPSAIAEGLLRILAGSDVLITDYIAVGGIGAAFVNAGLLMLGATALLRRQGVAFRGITVAAVFLMGSFGLFGKNICNVLPILMGTWLYTAISREPFAEHLHTALFATCLSPVVSEGLFKMGGSGWMGALFGLTLGLSIGFLIPLLAVHMRQIHGGFSLYNVGFTAGLLGAVYASLFKSYGYIAAPQLHWSTGNNAPLAMFLSVLFSISILFGFFISRSPKAELKGIFQKSGYGNNDFLMQYGLGACLINIGLNGIVATCYVLLAGGPLNGPTLGGILTIAGFGASGKHARNVIPLLLGAFLGSVTKIWNINDPAALLAALFGTSLAPIAGYYGWSWGIIAGFLNSSVALNSGVLHSGMNLYNTGFSAGIVAAVLIPLMNAARKARIMARFYR